MAGDFSALFTQFLSWQRFLILRKETHPLRSEWLKETGGSGLHNLPEVLVEPEAQATQNDDGMGISLLTFRNESRKYFNSTDPYYNNLSFIRQFPDIFIDASQCSEELRKYLPTDGKVNEAALLRAHVCRSFDVLPNCLAN